MDNKKEIQSYEHKELQAQDFCTRMGAPQENMLQLIEHLETYAWHQDLESHEGCVASVTQSGGPVVTSSACCSRSTHLGGSKMLSPTQGRNWGCLNSSYFRPVFIWAPEREWSRRDDQRTQQWEARKSITQRKLNRDWPISGFGSWKRCFRQNFYKLESIQIGTGECSGKKCHLINSSRNQGCFNLKSKALRSQTIAISKKRSINRFCFSSETLQKLRINDVNSREADFVSN